MYCRYIKPLLDKILALILLIIASPILIVVYIAIYLSMGSPVIFKQRRPGRDGKIFTIYKFRTMTNERDKDGNLLPDSQRLKGVGKTIRSLSLDELPQLFNVLKGEMSFIGPRPLLEEYLPLYTKEQNRRHEVTPGITGLAQVNGRNAISWEDKFRYDVEYVDNCSFLLDLKIIWLTIIKVLKRDGVNQAQDITMEKFKGSKK